MSTTVVALLPMKMNSERIRDKNFRVFNGKPLFRWILDTLLGIDEIDTVIINTDAREMLVRSGLPESKRVCIRDRDHNICGDLVSMNEIIADDVANTTADIYLMTHVTNPLLNATTIKAALHKFSLAHENDTADSLFSINRFRARFYREDGAPINHNPANLVRTQDLEPWYEENSNLYIFTPKSFASTRSRIGKRPMLFETPRLQSIDIDTPDDWELAEIVCRHLYPTQSTIEIQ